MCIGDSVIFEAGHHTCSRRCFIIVRIQREVIMSEARILIVDDHQEVGRALGRLLEISGYTVEVLSDGQKAIDRLEQMPWDLLLTDLFMPRIDGVELAKKALALDDAPAVLIMTGTPQSELVPLAIELTGQHPLAKPLSRVQLLKAIEDALENRSKSSSK